MILGDNTRKAGSGSLWPGCQIVFRNLLPQTGPAKQQLEMWEQMFLNRKDYLCHRKSWCGYEQAWQKVQVHWGKGHRNCCSIPAHHQWRQGHLSTSSSIIILLVCIQATPPDKACPIYINTLYTLIPFININLTIASTAAALFLMKNTKIILPFLLHFLSQASQSSALIHRVFSFLFQTIARDIIILPFILQEIFPFL